MLNKILFCVFLLLALVLLAGCGTQRAQADVGRDVDQEFSLTTRMGDGKIVYVGIGGEIDGLENPDLVVQPGETVRITLINGDGMVHDLSLPDFGAKTPMVSRKGQTVEVAVSIGDGQVGEFPYFCTQAGHRQAGQEGMLIVRDPERRLHKVIKIWGSSLARPPDF